MKKHKAEKPKVKISDIIIALIIILVISMIMYDESGVSAKEEAEKIADSIVGDKLRLAGSDGTMNDANIKELQQMSYDELKNAVNARKDFCVYIEDGDGKRTLVQGNENGPCREMGRLELRPERKT